MFLIQINLFELLKFYNKRKQNSKNESLNLSDSVGFYSNINKENIPYKNNNNNKFYYKKSLKKNLYNQEVLF